MINITKSKIHWNYFIALDKDLENLSRYIEFNKDNFNIYSIETARILFAASSEVDVIAKLLCKQLKPEEKYECIGDYKKILIKELPEITTMEVFINRYGLSSKPWSEWGIKNGVNPEWWVAYNQVKHHRDTFFNQATLKNVINSLGALLILVYCYYSYELSDDRNRLSKRDTMKKLEPNSTLLQLGDDYYYGHLLLD